MTKGVTQVSRSTRVRRALGVGVVVGGLVAGCSAGGTDTGGSGASAGAAGGAATITFVGYGGDGQKAMVKDWQEPFTKVNPGITFANTSPPDVAQVKAQVLSGNVLWDVIATAPAAAQQNCGTLFEKVDTSSIDTAALAKGGVGECYVGNFVLSTPFAYRTDAFPDASKAPKTIKDFFDVAAFPGRRGLVNNPQNGILEYPLLADGVAPDQMYPLDVDRALRKLDSIRQVTTFAPNVGALQQAVTSKQVDMFMLPDSRLVPVMNGGMGLTMVWDKTVLSLNAFAVPKGTKSKAAAEKFMAFVTTPEPSAAIAADLGVSPINKNSKPTLSENAKKVQALDPSVNPGATVLQDVDWYAKNYNQVVDKITKWLAG